MRSLDLSTPLASCSYYPVAIDLTRRLIRFAEIDRETYRQAGFLVPKQARMSEQRYAFNLDDVLLYDLSLPIGGAPSHYIFISAFCCSTLLARLLERVPGCFVLKEPSILGQLAMLRYRPRKSGDDIARDKSWIPASAGMTGADENTDDAKREHSTVIPAPLVNPAPPVNPTPPVIPAEAEIHSRDEKWTPACAGVTPPPYRPQRPSGPELACLGTAETESWEQEWQTWAGLGIRSLTRTFEPGQTVVVKAADTCNTMCEVILADDRRSKAVLLSVGLRTFILSVLKLENRRDWTRKRAQFWHKTLALFPALNAVNVPEIDDAQKAAYLWLATGAFWDRFQKQVEPGRLLLMDGEEVSENPGGALRGITAFFGLPLEENRIEEILADPVLNRHSKFPGQTYNAEQRRHDLADWEMRFGTDADRAMEWAAAIQEKLEHDGVNVSATAGSELKELAV